MDHNGRIQMVFGHGHRLSLKDLDDTVATEALLNEVTQAEDLGFVDDEPTRAQQHGRVLAALLQKVNLIMADLDALKTADVSIKAAVDGAANELHDLASRLADALASNDTAAIQAVTDDLTTAATKLSDATSSAQTIPAPLGTTPADPTQPPAAPATADAPPGDQAQPAGPVVTDTPQDAPAAPATPLTTTSVDPATPAADPAADNTAQGAAVASDTPPQPAS
jgi:hypothetical protein